MREAGIDISANRTKSVFDLFKAGEAVFVCDHGLRRGKRGALPGFPGHHATVALGGFRTRRVCGAAGRRFWRGTRAVRDSIKARIEEWGAEMRLGKG